MTLYELKNEVLELYYLLQEGEIEEDVFKDTLEGVEGDIDYKIDSYCKVIKQLEGESEMLKKESDRLKTRKETIDKNITRMKNTIQDVLNATGKQKVKTELFNVSLRKTPPKLIVTGEVPQEFLIPQEPKVDNASIKEMLKTQTLDFAHLEQGQSLSIR